MTPHNAEQIRDFILMHYGPQLARSNVRLDAITDEFDLLTEGIIDSLGVIEMISAIEAQFRIEVDLEGLEAEELTVLGPLSRYIAEKGVPAGQTPVGS